MKIYEPNLDIVVGLPFVSGDDEELTPTALDYKILDEFGSEVVALTNIPTFNADAGQHLLTIQDTDNALAAGALRGFRSIELRITVATDVHWVREGYILESASPLVSLVNSFQTYEESLLNSRDLVGREGWDEAEKEHRISAMIQAYDYLHAFSYQMNYIDDTCETISLTELTSTKWADLDPKQKYHFQRAQIAQADYLLGGSPIEQDIDDGLQSSTIGEISQFYRPRPTLTLPVCRRGLKFIGRYVDWAPRITRT